MSFEKMKLICKVLFLNFSTGFIIKLLDCNNDCMADKYYIVMAYVHMGT